MHHLWGFTYCFGEMLKTSDGTISERYDLYLFEWHCSYTSENEGQQPSEPMLH